MAHVYVITLLRHLYKARTRVLRAGRNYLSETLTDVRTVPVCPGNFISLLLNYGVTVTEGKHLSLRYRFEPLTSLAAGVCAAV
jgi:hypothetical protein